jgi:hypothetical protein
MKNQTASLAVDIIDKVEAWAADMPTLPKKQTSLSLREFVVEAFEALQGLVEKGYNYEEIKDLLEVNFSIEISAVTLAKYLYREKKSRCSKKMNKSSRIKRGVGQIKVSESIGRSDFDLEQQLETIVGGEIDPPDASPGQRRWVEPPFNVSRSRPNRSGENNG